MSHTFSCAGISAVIEMVVGVGSLFVSRQLHLLSLSSLASRGVVQRSCVIRVNRNFSKEMGLPRVYFDMTADGQPVGRIIIEVS